MKNKMPQMARTGKNGHGEPRPKVVCIGCKLLLPQNLFSYKIKENPSQGIRNRCKKCSAIRSEKERENRKNNWKYKPTLAMLNNSKQRAKSSGLEHTLTIDDIVIPEYCPVLNIKLDPGDRKRHGNAPSIDRIDNSKGYVKENIMIISNRANLLKNNATIDELIMIGNFYRNLKEQQN
jgi:hypothetical protein